MRWSRRGGILAETRSGSSGALSSLDAHAHDEYQIVLSEGVASTFRVAGRDYVAPPFSTVIVNPGEVHTARGDFDLFPDLPMRTLLIAPNLLAAPGEDLPFFGQTVLDGRRLYRDLVRLHLALGEAPPGLDLDAFAREVLAGLAEAHAERSGKRIGAPLRPEIVQACARLDAEFHRGVSLAELAEEGGMSPFHFCRLFGTSVGLSPRAYLRQRRVREARLLLERGVVPGEVAIEAGFSDRSHLTRVFRRIVGVTPGRYAPRAFDEQERSRFRPTGGR